MKRYDFAASIKQAEGNDLIRFSLALQYGRILPTRALFSGPPASVQIILTDPDKLQATSTTTHERMTVGDLSPYYPALPHTDFANRYLVRLQFLLSSISDDGKLV